MAQHAFANHTFVVDERAVQASEISEHEAITTQLDDAVFLRDNPVQKLNRIAWVPPERVVRLQFGHLLTLWSCKQKSGHNRRKQASLTGEVAQASISSVALRAQGKLGTGRVWSGSVCSLV